MLPALLRPLFWDYPPDALDWDSDADLITARVLSAGQWDAIQWLRRTVGDTQLRSWIQQREGRGLDARKLRFWEVVLGLPRRRVNAWLRTLDRQTWESRARR